MGDFIKAKIVALWAVLGASSFVVVTPAKVVGSIPKKKKNFELMHTIVETLADKPPHNKKGKK